ncbi:hypothetical protein ACIQF6_18235 [Kitasatospora sp. NPDC092948]|uniref:hypothetical protein n=1 Tax=Kitasatospora sp. NPDC092948 TaxID=3364088 RepID=UPI0038061AC1
MARPAGEDTAQPTRAEGGREQPGEPGGVAQILDPDPAPAAGFHAGDSSPPAVTTPLPSPTPRTATVTA